MTNIYRDKIEPFFRQPRVLLSYVLKRGMFNWMSDEQYLKFIWLVRMGYPLNLDNPRTFNEKLQWLKLHDHNPIYTTMADKYEAKQFVADRVGEEYVVPCYGVWEHFDDIEFDKLPEQFVLKTTHDNGGVVVVHDRDTFDRKAAKNLLERHLKINHYWWWREWAYKDIKPRIIAEKLLKNSDDSELVDYKFYSFNGKTTFSHIRSEIRTPKIPQLVNENGAPTDEIRLLYKMKKMIGELETNSFYDNDFNRIPCVRKDVAAPAESFPKPVNFEKMKEIANVLSEGIPHVRVDFYEVDGKLYVGELTFYTSAGYEDFSPEEFNYKFGDMITLPDKQEQNT